MDILVTNSILVEHSGSEAKLTQSPAVPHISFVILSKWLEHSVFSFLYLQNSSNS